MKRPFISWTVTVLLAAGASTAAYFVGKGSADNFSDELMAELEQLRREQSDAAVVKRVSQQMEDIAFLQKTVSDQERDRAEQQSELALAMRDRAEMESQLAKEAESKAKAAVAEAEEQRARALSHQQMAEEQRDAANLAKSISDTLNYRVIGRTLGNSAITLFESGNTEMASKMAYTSWFFLKTYKGNTYQPETYNALSLCSKSQVSIQTVRGGTIRALYSLGRAGCVAVTDYGEIEIHRTIGARRSVVLQNSAYDFRDVWANDSSIYALSLHGPLCQTDFKHLVREIPLPEGTYVSISSLDSQRFLIAARKHLLIMDKVSGEIMQRKELPSELSAIVHDDNGSILFLDNGREIKLDDNLTFSDISLTDGSRSVTAAYYDSRLSALFLGFENGDIELLDRHGKKITDLVGHTGKITDIITVGNIMVSSSFDSSVLIWNLPMLKFSNNESLAEALDISASQIGDLQEVAANEWMMPVPITFQSWPLALSMFSPTEAVAGTANGEVYRFNVSIDDMAGKLKDNTSVNFSDEEWERYVGSSVPHISF